MGRPYVRFSTIELEADGCVKLLGISKTIPIREVTSNIGLCNVEEVLKTTIEACRECGAQCFPPVIGGKDPIFPTVTAVTYLTHILWLEYRQRHLEGEKGCSGEYCNGT